MYEDHFHKDIHRAKKRGKDLTKLFDIISLLISEMPLPVKNHKHKLVGEFKDCWECHIEPDWLLIYKKTSISIILARMGTHSDLF